MVIETGKTLNLLIICGQRKENENPAVFPAKPPHTGSFHASKMPKKKVLTRKSAWRFLIENPFIFLKNMVK